jgi:hypothetical protein
VVGAAAAELLGLVVTPALARRLRAWQEQVGEGLRALERDLGVVIEHLGSNDAFIDVALQATQAALRTSQREKLEALRDAVMNSALPEPPGESVHAVLCRPHRSVHGVAHPGAARVR